MSAWGELRLAHRTKPQLPPLFYRVIVSHNTSSNSKNASLTLHVSDLVLLWTCSLHHSDILAEATRQHSPIDPSENSKQFTVLLDYLAQSVADTNNILVRDDSASSDDTSSALVLRTTRALPAPLRPLTFDFPLTQQPASAFAQTVLLPALQASQLASQKLDALIEVVKDKDHVIAKLLERVGPQASGDMSLVFPTLTGKRSRGGDKVGVKEAGKWVPGLNEFALDEWERKSGFDGGGGGEGVSGMAGKSLEKGMEIESAEWVENLRGKEALDDEKGTGRRLSRQVTRETTRGEDVDEDMTESEDEFERQPTPPGGKKITQSTVSPRTTATKQRQGDLTRTSPFGAGHQAVAKEPTYTTKAPTKHGKLGGIGHGKKSAPKSASVSRSSSSEPRPQRQSRRRQAQTPSASPSSKGPDRRVSKASTATATESEVEPDPQLARNTTSPSPLAIGRRARAESSPSSSSSTSSPEPQSRLATTSEVEPPVRQRTNRLGRIGRKTRTPSAEPVSSPTKPSGSSSRRNEHRRASPTEDTRASQHLATPSHRLGKLGLRRKDGTASPSTASKPKADKTKGRTPDPAADEDGTETESEDEGLDASARPKTRDQAAASSTKSHPDNEARLVLSPALKTSPLANTTRNKRSQEEEAMKEPETAEEAAARRREELKRTAAQAPAKKKRRF